MSLCWVGSSWTTPTSSAFGFFISRFILIACMFPRNFLHVLHCSNLLRILLQTLDNDVTRVQSATELNASVQTLQCKTCSKCCAMDCCGTYFTHVQTCDVTRVHSAAQWTASVHTFHQTCDVTRVQRATHFSALGADFTHVQTCDATHVQSAAQWTASVHTSHMFKPVV